MSASELGTYMDLQVNVRVKREAESPQRLGPPNGPIDTPSAPAQKSLHGGFASPAPPASSDPYTLLNRGLSNTIQRFERQSSPPLDGLPSQPQVHAHNPLPPYAQPQYSRFMRRRSLSPIGPHDRPSDPGFGPSFAANSRYTGNYSNQPQADDQERDNGFKRHSLNAGLDKYGSLDSPWKGHKRPLSPGSSRHGRSISPPFKRRVGESGLNGSSVEGYDPRNWKYSSASASAKVDTENRPRKSSSPVGSRSWAPPSRQGASAEHTPSIPAQGGVTPSTNGQSVGTPTGGARQPQSHALNRELWDIRRQVTALKAREDAIVHELQVIHAPVGVLPEPSASSKQLSLEERLKSMEVEIQCTSFFSCHFLI